MLASVTRYVDGTLSIAQIQVARGSFGASEASLTEILGAACDVPPEELLLARSEVVGLEHYLLASRAYELAFIGQHRTTVPSARRTPS